MKNNFGICLHTFTRHPKEDKPKNINYYGVISGDQLIVTKDNHGDFYALSLSNLESYTPGDNYVIPTKNHPLPIPTSVSDKNLQADISAAHQSWKAYFKKHPTPKSQRKQI